MQMFSNAQQLSQQLSQQLIVGGPQQQPQPQAIGQVPSWQGMNYQQQQQQVQPQAQQMQAQQTAQLAQLQQPQQLQQLQSAQLQQPQLLMAQLQQQLYKPSQAGMCCHLIVRCLVLTWYCHLLHGIRNVCRCHISDVIQVCKFLVLLAVSDCYAL
jgi:hypothetical protein